MYAPALTVRTAATGSCGGAILLRNGHAARRVRRTRAARQRIDVVVQPAETRVVAPGLLDELELTLQAGVHAEEMHAARLAIVLQVRQRLEEVGSSTMLPSTRGSKRGVP